MPHDRMVSALRKLTGNLIAGADKASFMFDAAFEAWNKNERKPQYLLSRKDLREVVRYRQQLHWDNYRIEKEDYFNASLVKRRRFFQRVVTSVVVLVILMGVGGWKLIKSNKAEQIKRTAIELLSALEFRTEILNKNEIETLWRLANANEDIRIEFFRQLLASPNFSEKFNKQSAVIVRALVGLNPAYREHILAKLPQFLKTDNEHQHIASILLAAHLSAPELAGVEKLISLRRKNIASNVIEMALSLLIKKLPEGHSEKKSAELFLSKIPMSISSINVSMTLNLPIANVLVPREQVMIELQKLRDFVSTQESLILQTIAAEKMVELVSIIPDNLIKPTLLILEDTFATATNPVVRLIISSELVKKSTYLSTTQLLSIQENLIEALKIEADAHDTIIQGIPVNASGRYYIAQALAILMKDFPEEKIPKLLPSLLEAIQTEGDVNARSELLKGLVALISKIPSISMYQVITVLAEQVIVENFPPLQQSIAEGLVQATLKLNAEQTHQVLPLFLEILAIQHIKSRLLVAQGVTNLSVNLPATEIQPILFSLIHALDIESNSSLDSEFINIMETLTKKIVALSAMLPVEQIPDILLSVQEPFSRVRLNTMATVYAEIFVSLASRLDWERFSEISFEVLKYPTCTPEAMEIILEALEKNAPDHPTFDNDVWQAAHHAESAWGINVSSSPKKPNLLSQ